MKTLRLIAGAVLGPALLLLAVVLFAWWAAAILRDARRAGESR